MRAFPEAVARYDGEPRVGMVAAALMVRHGALTVWTNPAVVTAGYAQDVVDAWVRLQIVRGRRFAVFTAADLYRSRHPQHAALEANAPSP